MSIENLLNASIDNIDDLPATSAWPIGAHVASVKMEVNQKNPKKPLIIARATLISTEEQADPEATPAKPGDQYSFMYNLMKKDSEERNEFALQQIKTYFGNPLVESGDLDASATLSDVIAAYTDGVELLITTGHRTFNDEKQMTIKSVAKV